jgi:hypothetical protein
MPSSSGRFRRSSSAGSLLPLNAQVEAGAGIAAATARSESATKMVARARRRRAGARLRGERLRAAPGVSACVPRAIESDVEWAIEKRPQAE